MLEIINKLFEEANYEINNIKLEIQSVKNYIPHNSFLAKSIDNNKFDFFLVMEFKKGKILQDYLQQVIDEYFEHILKANTEAGVDKNLSLVILIHEDEVQVDMNQKSFVYDLEEDPFDFKKYVIFYNENQKLILNSWLSKTNNYTKLLQDIVQDKEMFTNFKHNQYKDEKNESTLLYDFVSKCFIKLHFLSININPLKLSNLKQEIEDGLTKTELDVRKKILSYDYSEDSNIEVLFEFIGGLINEK